MSAAAALLALLTVAQPGVPCDDVASLKARWEGKAQAVIRDAPSVSEALLQGAEDGAHAPWRMQTACAVQSRWSQVSPQVQGVGVGVDRALLEEIYARPAFAHARSRKDGAFDRFVRRALAFFEELFGTRGATAFVEGTRVMVLALALAALAGGVLRVVSLRRGGRRGGRRGAGGLLTEAGAPLELADPAVHLGHARAALSHDGREAIRQALLALLSSLEQRRWARPDRVKTNRELASELPKRGAPVQITREVERIVGWYDRTFYSLAPVAQEEARRFVEEVAALDARVAGGAA